MMADGVSIPIFTVMLVVFAAVTIFLGLYGYRNTKNNSEFLLGRNKTNPLIIGLSYGATFLSASISLLRSKWYWYWLFTVAAISWRLPKTSESLMFTYELAYLMASSLFP